MRTKIFTPLLACLLGWGMAVAPGPASAQSASSMSCAQTQPGGTAQCGTLTVSSGSIYPERIVGVNVLGNSSFIISANSCVAPLELINNPCSMSISYNAGAMDAGTFSAVVMVTYQICSFDADNQEHCGAATPKPIAISVFVTPTPAANPGPAPVTVPATANSPSNGTDVSYLPNCFVNVSAQKFCVVVPL
jgi:hypothetical protein